jgi:hypothetical protein
MVSGGNQKGEVSPSLQPASGGLTLPPLRGQSPRNAPSVKPLCIHAWSFTQSAKFRKELPPCGNSSNSNTSEVNPQHNFTASTRPFYYCYYYYY